MSFIDDFPSLKGKIGCCDEDYDWKNDKIPEGMGYVGLDDIQKYCIDKQKVREILDKIDKRIEHIDMYYDFGKYEFI